MKTIDHIPTNKLGRAGQLIKTGVKVGGNYLAYYGEKLVNKELTKDKLHENNAEDIYDGLKSLKGSALKVAQMLSMDKSIMPQQFVEKFSLAQFSVPPLSAPLVKKTFKRYFGIDPNQMFDTFSNDSIYAASIGQVHQATKNGKTFAVKIQYPGVAESISSDLAMVKPIAMRMFNLQGKDSERYFKEVEEKLLEETNYELELKQGQYIASACKAIPNLKFPTYYFEFSNDKVLTMDWMEGIHLSEFSSKNKNQELSNQIGQTLWDFYMVQMHGLRQVHADPHPGNFLVSADGQLIAIDFGCVKHVPEDFYLPYFELSKPEVLANPAKLEAMMLELEILRLDDSVEDKQFFKELFTDMLQVFTKPFHGDSFDFSDDIFFTKMAQLGETYAGDTKLRKMNGNRGSKHFLYINRTFFGLYSLLHDIKAKVQTQNFVHYLSS